MKMRLGILFTRWGWRVVFLLFQKVMGPVSFQWHIGPYWQIRIKNLCKRHAKKNQEMYQMYDVYQNG
jgi:hypothetical protein